MKEWSRPTRKVSDVDAVGGAPRDKLHIELFGGIVVKVATERIDVEHNKTMLASQRENLSRNISLDTGLVRPSFT